MIRFFFTIVLMGFTGFLGFVLGVLHARGQLGDLHAVLITIAALLVTGLQHILEAGERWLQRHHDTKRSTKRTP